MARQQNGSWLGCCLRSSMVLAVSTPPDGEKGFLGEKFTDLTFIDMAVHTYFHIFFPHPDSLR